jgi:hypothetical protein
MTLDLFSNTEDEQLKNRKDKIGQTDIQYIKSASILTEAKGFMGAYDYATIATLHFLLGLMMKKIIGVIG